MKWYFAVSAASLQRPEHDWPGLLQAAVNSARRNTTLQPHLLYDGEPDVFTDDLARRGVTIIPHRARLYAALSQYAAQHGHDRAWLALAAGAFLRLDIPLIEQTDAVVLYTDADVLFLCEPNFFRGQPPALFGASGELTDRYEDMNSGVMLINVPAMRADHDQLSAFATANLNLGLDQEILRAHYRGRYDFLDRSLNWKPYWGLNPAAQIVHFHGPKPVLARRFLDDGSLPHNLNWRALLRRDPRRLSRLPCRVGPLCRSRPGHLHGGRSGRPARCRVGCIPPPNQPAGGVQGAGGRGRRWHAGVRPAPLGCCAGWFWHRPLRLPLRPTPRNSRRFAPRRGVCRGERATGGAVRQRTAGEVLRDPVS